MIFNQKRVFNWISFLAMSTSLIGSSLSADLERSHEESYQNLGQIINNRDVSELSIPDLIAGAKTGDIECINTFIDKFMKGLLLESVAYSIDPNEFSDMTEIPTFSDEHLLTVLVFSYQHREKSKKFKGQEQALPILINTILRRHVETRTSILQYAYGYMSYYGFECKKDREAAAFSFKQSARQGFVHAQRFLGFLYENGVSVKKNKNKAIEWYEKASAQGDTSALLLRGVLYEFDEKNEQKAMECYQNAANRGCFKAQNHLGRWYKEKGCETDSHSRWSSLNPTPNLLDKQKGFLARGFEKF